ncbi:hypothetical protein Pcinc_039824 [Petrolisthes cinctipes]|uniref:Uncharacterized protein n=1 Tax=Petrolisthes cinctipes TaxID=88211 RepID=A0AAE1EJ53_PETCI|nr:hypothetical protein Pcinc_039824 [Petrolisthes cinctipes]
MMQFASDRVTQVADGAGSFVAHSHLQGSVVARTRGGGRSGAAADLDIHAQNGVRFVRRRSGGQMCQGKGKGKGASGGTSSASGGTSSASGGTSSATLSPPPTGAATATTDLNWSPLPRRHGVASESLCVALYCDDSWDDRAANERASGACCPRPVPVPSTPRHARSTLRTLTFADEKNIPALEAENGDLSPPPSPGLHLRPFTNPRDTPTHHPPPLPSPAHRITRPPAHDLTLESLHDLNWLQQMEPQDQVLLEVHVIWSILSLMVVLLACYTLHHQPLTG